MGRDDQRTILVVDDELSIRKALEGVLRDEGYQVVSAETGDAALLLMDSVRPAAVLLDIWMPGSDGLEVLQRMQQRFADVPVVMMSGHATIATAMKATKLGAFDFIEKPLDLKTTVTTLRRALEALRLSTGSPVQEKNLKVDSVQESGRGRSVVELLNRMVFLDQRGRGRRVPQRTLKAGGVMYGQGLHSGKKSGLILEPLPSNSGIHFIGVSETTPVPAHVDFVLSTGWATTVKLESTQAGTIEHLMSALHAYGIANLLVKCNGEVPVMDGSALEFCRLIEEVGIEEQPGDWFELLVEKPIRIGDEKEFIEFAPHESFVIDYTLEYPAPLGTQRFVFNLDSVDAYKREIAGARTFGFVKDIQAVQQKGLALGGRFDNFVMFDNDGAVNTTLRFPDEPVRHKILDAIGDLYLLGRPLRGKITARRTGHSDNVALLRKVNEVLLAQSSGGAVCSSA